jgi:AraC family transcriptional regulator, regulatory protein of adaptative response / methylated-DNA-[protein]-cysteine methyltransferase
MKNIPSSTTMYRALVRRDTTYEGVFFAGVRTTGIFCRPTCPSKKPKPANVEFFPTSKEALFAGYRPCLRCRPLEQQKPAPPLVARLLRAVERAPEKKWTDSDLRTRGIDPSTVRRQFQRAYGMTFHAYHRARRMGLAMQGIRGGSAVIETQLESGYESASGFWEAFRKVFGTPPSRALDTGCLLARQIETPLGTMLALADAEGLRLLEFVDRRGLEREIALLRTRTRCAVVPGENPHLAKIERELKGYFAGTSFRFTVPMVPTGSPFELAVWKQLQAIPPGETRSYSDLARGVGRPLAARAIGRANGRNSLAVIIPCHRVIRADGELCGYGGGVWRKRWLLEHERRHTQEGRP